MNDCVDVELSVLVARTINDSLGCHFKVDRTIHRHDAGHGINRHEPPPALAVERVSHRVGAIQIIGKRCYTTNNSTIAEFSATTLTAPFTSVIEVMSNSLISVTEIVKSRNVELPSVLSACTRIVCDVLVS